MTEDWATVIPAEGQQKETIRLLLSLAASNTHVRTSGGTQELRVPEYLADRYHEAIKPKPRRTRAKKEEGEEQ